MKNIEQALLESVVSEELADMKASFLFEFAPSFPGFEGHFPENPVLPAVAQVMAAVAAASRWSLKNLMLKRLQRAKFMRIIVPGDQVLLTCTAMENFRKTDLFREKKTVSLSCSLSVGSEKAALFKLELSKKV